MLSYYPLFRSPVLKSRAIVRPAATATIGTHDGTFHCDEALGCWLLKNTDRFRDAKIIRTRNAEVLEATDVVLDVGGVYDPERLRFDHHQRGFEETFGNGSHTRLSSAGLIYKHFGLEVISHIVKSLNLSDDDIDRLYKRTYNDFFQAIDGIDNGLPVCSRTSDGSKARVNFVDGTNLTARVSRLNVHWKCPATMSQDVQFEKAVELCGSELTDYVSIVAQKWLPAEQEVKKSLGTALDISPSGEIMFLEIGCPWIRSLFELGKYIETARKIKYCIYYPEFKDDLCHVHAVPMSPNSTTPRLPFPEEWRGMTSGRLDALTGIQGCVFVHRTGFLAGHRTKDGAIAMAEASLRAQRWSEAYR